MPVEGASLAEDRLTVPYAKDHVKDAPDIDTDEISQDTESAPYAHLRARLLRGPLGDGSARGGRAGLEDLAETMKEQAAVTRSEEELRVGVTREPVDETAGDREIGDESPDVTLREERPVVEKETVAKEKIGVEKSVETETETVSREVRKERVDVDDETRR